MSFFPLFTNKSRRMWWCVCEQSKEKNISTKKNACLYKRIHLKVYETHEHNAYLYAYTHYAEQVRKKNHIFFLSMIHIENYYMHRVICIKTIHMHLKSVVCKRYNNKYYTSSISCTYGSSQHNHELRTIDTTERSYTHTLN